MKEALKIIDIYVKFLFVCYNKVFKINNGRNYPVKKKMLGQANQV